MEENQAKLRLQMELDSKDSEIETLQMKIASLNSETASVSSIENDDGEDSVLSEHGTMRLEGWLNVPNKQNIKRHGWKKQYVVVSSKKIIFYNSENDKMNADPVLILDLNKVFHVRSVTQGDVIRANAKDIPRIFQVLLYFYLLLYFSILRIIRNSNSFHITIYSYSCNILVICNFYLYIRMLLYVHFIYFLYCFIYLHFYIFFILFYIFYLNLL